MLLWVARVAKLPVGTMNNKELWADNEFKASLWRLRLGSGCLAGTTNNGECLCFSGTSSALYPGSYWDTTRKPTLMLAACCCTGRWHSTFAQVCSRALLGLRGLTPHYVGGLWQKAPWQKYGGLSPFMSLVPIYISACSDTSCVYCGGPLVNLPMGEASAALRVAQLLASVSPSQPVRNFILCHILHQHWEYLGGPRKDDSQPCFSQSDKLF